MSFRFGARVGERIRGRLFRGRGGRFASEEEVEQVQSELLRKLIARLRAKRATGTGGKRTKKAGKKPKKPKRGGGKRAKKTAEQIAREKRAQKQENLNKIFGVEGKLADRLGVQRNELFDIEGFLFDNKPLSPESTIKFAQLGFVEIDADGEPRMTSSGRSLLNAAGRGDTRKAADALSKMKEQVQKKRDRIDKLRKRADKAEDAERVSELRQQAEDLARSIGESTQQKSLSSFGSQIRAAIRGLWRGVFDEFEFVDAMTSAIRLGMRDAWIAGAAECGIGPDEFTVAEISALQQAVNSQLPHLPGFAMDIAESSRENKGKLGLHLDRGELWINQYPSVQSQAKQMACRDKKLKWVIDPTKDNCRSCLRLNQKVKRASFWQERDIRPQNPPNGKLECEGWRCGCGFQVTDEPLSKGRLPGLP